MIDPSEPNGEAQRLIDSPVLAHCFEQLERSAMEAAIYARADDDLQRLTSMLRVQVLRSLRQELEALARGPTAPPDRGAVA